MVGFSKGLVTVPHLKRELPKGTLKSIEKQAKISLLGDSL
jgi:predicted RNA binding protein YcfA (HicA-like mRNA interferase family)